MKNIKIKIRIILWCILALIVLWLLYMAIVPFGKITYQNNFSQEDYFVRELTPLERVADGDRLGTKLITGDPVYFSLRTPRTFGTVKLAFKYRRIGDHAATPVIEIGSLVDKTIWRHDLKPIENRIIDQLSLAWHLTRDGDVILLQKENKYNSINEFLANLPGRDEIAIYNYELDTDYILAGYEPRVSVLSSGPLRSNDSEARHPELSSEVPHPLRGAYQFYTYIKDEKLNFNFTFQDLNQNKDIDEISFFLYYDGELIDSRQVDDDGITGDSGEISDDREAELKLGGLPEGAYKIEVKANSDIVTKKINTSQSKLAFINKLRLLKDGSENINLYTDSHIIQVLTIHPDRLQTIELGNNELVLDKTYTQFEVRAERASSSDKYAKILLARDGVEISGGGVFSFDPGALINPRLKRVDEKLEIDPINYIIARYKSPAEEDSWKISITTHDLSRAYREDGQYSFIISVPGLEGGDYVEVDEILVELQGKTLWGKVKEVISKIGKTGS